MAFLTTNCYKPFSLYKSEIKKLELKANRDLKVKSVTAESDRKKHGYCETGEVANQNMHKQKPKTEENQSAQHNS